MTTKSSKVVDVASNTIMGDNQYGFNPRFVFPYSTTTGPSVESYESFRTGGYMPGWKAQIARHGNATTALLGVKRSIYRRKGSGYGQYDNRRIEPGFYPPGRDPRSSGYEQARGDFLGLPGSTSWGFGSPSLSASESYEDALAAAYRDATRALKSFQGLTFLGELRETLRMIRRPAEALRRGLSSYLTTVKKRGRRYYRYKRKEHSLQRVVSGTWLEYAYGWAPLVNDVRDAAVAAAKLQNRRVFKRFTGHGKSEKANTVTGVETRGSYMQFQSVSHYYEKVETKFYGEVFCDTGNSYSGLSEHFGVSWSDIVPTVWELIPYSFLVDYFVNVGDLISSLSFPQASIQWASYNQRYVTRVTHTGSPLPWESNHENYWGNIRGSLDPGSVRFEQSGIQRHPIASLPIPTLRFTVPGASKKWINMAALVTQRNEVRRSLNLQSTRTLL